ncbi:hypothetical protein [Clostridium hydrogeniformans]|uniref:hypothetical protein n=1 Tax=Clostridium hydrogeniformans TaxID=349933 RepID=UPI0004852B69|nr:hypothetical protein [Clostridium hydrogeniformans]
MSFRFPIGYDVSFYEDNKEGFGQIVDRREVGEKKIYTIYTEKGKKKQCREEELELYYFDPMTIYVIEFSDGKFLEYGENGTIRRVSLKNADKWHYKWHGEEEAKKLSEILNEEVRCRCVELVLK